VTFCNKSEYQRVKAEREPDELTEAWLLTGDNWGLAGNKPGVTCLGFAVMLKFYEIEGRFPSYPEAGGRFCLTWRTEPRGAACAAIIRPPSTRLPSWAAVANVAA
jgi:hypothetical protein